VKRIVVVVVLVVVLVAVLVGASLAAAAPSPRQSPTKNENGAIVEDVPIDVLSDDMECAGGEFIEVTGTLHLVGHFVPVQGGHRIIFHLNYSNMKGVGLTTGKEYVVISNEQQVDNFVPSGQSVEGMVLMNLEIGKGQVPNEVAVLQQHYIVTPEGEIKMETDQFQLKCPGGSTAPPTAAASAAATTP
jgi:hypothetical protein